MPFSANSVTGALEKVLFLGVKFEWGELNRHPGLVSQLFPIISHPNPGDLKRYKNATLRVLVFTGELA